MSLDPSLSFQDVLTTYYSFGGIKSSGFGKEGSMYGIDEYMTMKMITLGAMDKKLQCHL